MTQDPVINAILAVSAVVILYGLFWLRGLIERMDDVIESSEALIKSQKALIDYYQRHYCEYESEDETDK